MTTKNVLPDILPMLRAEEGNSPQLRTTGILGFVGECRQ